MSMKLDLQLFAEGENGGIAAVDDTTAMDPELSLEEMYQNGASAEDDSEEEATGEESSGSGDGAETETNAGEDSSVESEQEEQPWKNQYNAEMAAQRRRQEEAQRVQRARDEIVRETYAGQINPYTNRPILTEADLRQYQQQYQQEQLQQAGIDPAMIQQMINNHPVVQQSQQLLAQQRQARGQQLLQEEVRAISQIDPAIKTVQDVIQLDNFQEINQMVQQGYKLSDAYKLANMDRITQRRQAAAKQQMINQAAGKRHLQATGQNGAGNEVQIPADVLAMYHEMMPDATDGQIKKHYAKTRKG